MHPKWTIKTLQKHFNRLKNTRMLRMWKDDVKRGGTTIDKWMQIETQTFEYFQEARKFLEQVKLEKNIYIL